MRPEDRTRHFIDAQASNRPRRRTLQISEGGVSMLSTLMTKEDFAGLGAPDLVYVREITAADVISDTPLQDAGGIDINPEQTLYAVHSADGERLAVMMDRETAFAAAVAHELAPVSVH
jgi:hypothetical protein